MKQDFDLRSPRAIAMVSKRVILLSLKRTALAMVLTTCLTVLAYWFVFGFDDRFFATLILAAIVAFCVAITLTIKTFGNQQKLETMTVRLRETRAELRETNAKLEHKLTYDNMTGLECRESFFAKFEKRRAEHEQNLLLLLDADHFKKINDTYGHLLGDQALLLLSDVLKRMRRQNDLIGRIGGEEFTIFLPNTSEAEGLVIAEMIRGEIENLVFKPMPGVHHVITASIGITSAPPHQKYATLMSNADNALYEAKHAGRNQVKLYDPSIRRKPKPAAKPGYANSPNYAADAPDIVDNRLI